MKICQRDFRSRHKKKLVLFQPIHVGLELGQLRCADHAIAPDKKRRTDFGATMFACVQIDHEIDQRTFQSRAGAGETDEIAAAQLRRALEIKNFQFLAKRHVIGRVTQLRFLSPAADYAIAARVFADRNALVRQICNLEQ